VGILDDGELVAVDTVEGLREAAGAGAELRLRVDRQPDFDVAAMDGVDAASAADGMLRVTCGDPRAKGQVVARLVNEGVDVLDVDGESASLEDVFAAYTGNGHSTTTGATDDLVAGPDEDAGDADAAESEEVTTA
jgi:ABC-2 type transport system ATP-binding protein